MKDMFLSEYLVQQVHSNTLVSDKVQQPKPLFKPFTKPIVDIISDLNFLPFNTVKGVLMIGDKLEFYMMFDEGSEPKLLVRNKKEEDDFSDYKYFTSFYCLPECVDDVSNYSKQYFVGLISLCLCSVKINDQFKQSLLNFTKKALLIETLSVLNYWELNCQKLLMLIKQHKVTDFNFQ
ncbi:hypothetical protein ACOYR1_14095 [Thalassotalea piscium]